MDTAIDAEKEPAERRTPLHSVNVTVTFTARQRSLFPQQPYTRAIAIRPHTLEEPSVNEKLPHFCLPQTTVLSIVSRCRRYMELRHNNWFRCNTTEL